MPAVLTCPYGHRWPWPDTQGPGSDRVTNCPVCGTIVDLVSASVADLADERVGPGGEPQPFPELPGYDIQAMIGRGGMGVVYRAFDRKHGRVVALKTMQWADASALYRFKQEFRALAGLAHPNLVSLYELVSEGGHWFFTMELIEGTSFLAHVRAADCRPHDSLYSTRIGLTPPQMGCLRHATQQLAAGVEALHDAGKLHRDIKPGNVLVTKQGRVVLLDFGLAAELDRAGVHQSTEPHLLGTVAYMAPEQAASQPVSPASDWYAVGVMLYEALTGSLPFSGSAVDVLLNKQREEPPPPRSLASDVPEDLNALAVDLLRRDPAARPSGRAILQRLAGRPIEEPASAVAPPPRSHPLLIGRKPHLQSLADALQTTRQGKTVLFHVRGRSGVGKSALIQAFLDGLEESEAAVVLTGRCYEQEAVPYKALDSLVDALSRYLIRLPSLQTEALLPRDVLALARVFPVLRRVSAIAQAPQRPLDPTDAQEVRRRALAALRELLGRLGDRRPVVLFIDDLQWGDMDSAALLVDLLRPPEAPTLLLLVAYRSEETATSPCLQALLGPAATEPGTDSGNVSVSTSLPFLAALPASTPGLDRREMTVEPLSVEETRELALELLDSGRPHAATQAQTIARESGGNPFFVLELVQHIQQSIPMSPGTRAAQPEQLTLGEALWTRVQRLPETARRLLEVVAVSGRPLRQTEACQAAGLSADSLSALAPLRTDRLVRSTGPAEHEQIETYHDRIRETVVNRLQAAALKGHHRALAEVLAASGQADPERLAIHFRGAGDSAEAGKHYALAAAQAAEALAFDRAAKLYLTALQLRGGEGLEQQALRIQLADALANAGRGGESAREYLAAAAAAAPADALELQRRAALQFLISGHVDSGLTALRTVLGKVGMSMPASSRRAFWGLVTRQIQLRLRGLGFHRRAASEIPAADLTRIDTCWSASLGLSMVDTIYGAYFQTRGLLFALSAGEPFRLARSLAMEAGHVSIGGSHSRQRMARLLEAAESLAQQVDVPYPRGLIATVKGVAAAFEGNWEQAVTFCDQAEAILRGSCTGVIWELDTAQRYGLWARMYLGEVGAIARRLPVLLKEAQQRDDLYAVLNLVLVVGTFVRLAADQPDQARVEIDRVMNLWPREGFHVQHMNRLHDEAQIDLYQGDGKAAWDRLAAAWPMLAGSHFMRVQQVRIFMRHLRARAALAAASGVADREPLLRAAEKDARALSKEGIRWADELTRLVRAGIAMTRGQPDAARLLREAAAGLDAVEMPLHAAAARRALGRLMGGTEGQTLEAQAEEWMRQQTIANPGRMSTLLVPEPGLV